MKAKKVLAMLMASAMIMGTSVTAFGSNKTYTDAARVMNLESDNLTVTAYQIIKYNEAGYYEEVEGIKGEITTNDETADGRDILDPTSEDIEKLAGANYLSKLTTSVTFTADKTTDTVGDYKYENLAPGAWMIIVTGSDQYLYNPAIISVNVTSDGTKYGELNYETDTWEPVAYPKRSEPKITKTAEKAKEDDTEIVGVQYNDVLKFTLEADIPDYSADVTGVEQYIIKDTLDGLSLVQSTEYPVTVAMSDGTAIDTTVESIIKNAISVNAVEFSADLSEQDEFLLQNGGKKIVITYYAKVTSTEKINVDELNNTAELSYSTRGGVAKKEATTKHYTFGFDTGFNGTVTTENKTGEFIKIDESGDVVYVEQPSGEVEVKATNPLEGAMFELRIGNSSGEVFGTYTTGSDGRLEVNGLDSDVTYYLVETKAPSGYTVNATPVKVEINATYEGSTLTGYNVVFDDIVITHYTYEDGETTIVNDEDTASNPFGFKNTTLTDLPSTGGIGTTIFTIGGCAIMVTAAGLYFATRKKTEK